jgi:hypothetical protein
MAQASPTATEGTPKPVTRVHRIVVMLAAAVLFCVSMVAGTARQTGDSSGYDWQGGLLFGAIALVFLFPLLLLIQRWLVKIIVRLRHGRGAPARMTRRRLYWSYLPTLLICAVTVSSFTHSGDEYYYRRYMNGPPPPSMRHFGYFSASGFGNGNWILYFEIDPEDMPAVLAGRRYVQRPVDDDDLESLNRKVKQLSRVDIPAPSEPLVHCYAYASGGGAWIQFIYTNAAQTRVYVRGRYG